MWYERLGLAPTLTAAAHGLRQCRSRLDVVCDQAREQLARIDRGAVSEIAPRTAARSEAELRQRPGDEAQPGLRAATGASGAMRFDVG